MLHSSYKAIELVLKLVQVLRLVRKMAFQEVRMSKKHDFQIKKWESLINECQNSGKKIKDWCEDNCISKHQYYYWLNKIRNECYDEAVSQFPTVESVTAASIPVPKHSFIELRPEVVGEVPKSVDITNPVAVIQNENMRIEIMSNASASFIRQLLEAVRYA